MKATLNGLVLCGGQSSRMGSDKYLLDYHGMPQYDYTARLLMPFCDQVFLSCNKQQAGRISSGFQVIEDKEQYQQAGPLTGLLSAFLSVPGSDWLVLGCDYPLLGSAEVQLLADVREAHPYAAAFFNGEQGFYEPLLAVYRAPCHPLLDARFKAGQHSLRHFLREYDAFRCIAADSRRIESIDTRARFEAIRKVSGGA